MSVFKSAVLVIVLVCGCSSDPELVDPATDTGADLEPTSETGDVAPDVGGRDVTHAGNSGGADLGSDVGSDLGSDGGHDAGTDLGSDTGDDAGPDVGGDTGSTVECVSGGSGFESDGMGNTMCDTEMVCDGVSYFLECVNDSCTCTVDGMPVNETTTEGCTYDGLRDCGAPIPPTNPTCYEYDIYSGGGGDFCESGVTCDDVDYVLICEDATNSCTCTVDDMPGPMSTHTDCLDAFDALIECGAPLQTNPD